MRSLMGKNGNYDPSFAREVFENVDFGDEIKMCMQCGVCAASCPLSLQMDHPPRQIFTLIRAGKKEEVLGSQAIMLCTSCYACKVRCPRKIPVVDVMHGLANYALKQGFVPRKDTANFGSKFWEQVYRIGRIDEKDLPRRYFFSEGFIEGIKGTLSFSDIGIKMFLHKRMKLLPEKKIKGIKELRKMLDKAETMQQGGASA
ncbi:MAG: 4Fe-4S dicluster domain-containing protein [Desulfobacteraceae bacterium]|nr:4Fe-4S dicluster domain-containing protein [Desulfobacteraceae bacterium]